MATRIGQGAAPGRIRIGLSGWTYAPWRGVFYPEKLAQDEELSYAASLFDSIEVNGTFYRLQQPASFLRWCEETPEDFVFSVKAPRYITHVRRLREIETPLANFLASGLLLLGEKLGPLLWQFPPFLRYDAPRFEAFFAMLPHDTAQAARLARAHDERIASDDGIPDRLARPLRHAIEIRHESFRDPTFIEMLRRHDVALVCADTVSWPRLMDLTADFVYCRLHGSEELYVSGYDDASLDAWARRVLAWADGGEPQDAERVLPALASSSDGERPGRDVFVYFDNDVKVRAPADADSLLERVSRSIATSAPVRWTSVLAGKPVETAGIGFASPVSGSRRGGEVLDALLLSRLQFAWVIAFHILLPAFTVGLSCYIATLETLWWTRKDDVYRRLSAFWIKIFAISFGMGVVSGVVMPFQFGTNWSRFIDASGSVIGPLLGYEVITAFFLEAAFLGVLLFGRKLVPQWAHVLSAYLVALGTLLSSFWILAANSWMQTPTGHEVVDGRFVPVDLVQLIFNPSFPYRLVHTVTAFVVTTALVILGVGAHFLLHRRHADESRIMVRMSLVFLTVMVPFQIIVGDLHGVNTLHHQPAKLAAMEGLWESTTHVPLSLFGLPDEQAERNRYEIAIPAVGSLYLTHGFSTEVKGLKAFPPEDRPPVAIPYFAFRIMVGLGILMLAIVISGWVAYKRGRLYESRAFLRFARLGMPTGFLAVLAGWTVTEVGRQPWVVYGLMRTADGVSPSLTAADVTLSFAAYIVGYLVMFGGGFVLLRRMVLIGPERASQRESEEADEARKRSARPLSAATDEPHRGAPRPAGATFGPQREARRDV